MTQIKRVPWAMFVGAVFQKLIEEGFCSSAWLKACVRKVMTEQGAFAQIDVSNYPPGGRRQTKMLHCQECKRWGPRHGFVRYAPTDDHSEMRRCLDCVTNNYTEVFEEHLSSVKKQDKSLARQLERLSWQSATVHERIHSADQEYSDTRDINSLDLSEKQFGYRRIGNEYWHTFRSHVRWVGKDSNSNDPRYNLLMELENTDDRRKFPKRSLGCQGVMLDESEDRLLYEIEYYRKNNRLLPSTRRSHRINPFQVRQEYLESAVPPSNEEFGIWDLD